MRADSDTEVRGRSEECTGSVNTRSGLTPPLNGFRAAHAIRPVIIAYMRPVPWVMCGCMWTVIFPPVRFPITDA